MEIGRSRARDYDIFKQSFVSSDHTLHQGFDKMNKIEPLVYWTFTVQTTLTLGCEQQKKKPQTGNVTQIRRNKLEMLRVAALINSFINKMSTNILISMNPNTRFVVFLVL